MAVISGLWRPQTGIFLALLLFLLWLGRSQFLYDPGVFWSSVLGQRILAEGAVPRAETFSFTRPGQPWNSHQWLAQVLMALVHAIGGFDGLVFAAAVLLAVICTALAHRLLRAGWHGGIVAVLIVLAVLASRYHLHARPHLASIALMAFVFARLGDFEEGRISARGLLWLPPAFILWTNLHGGALGGLATLTLVVGGWCAAWLVGWRSPLRDGRGVGQQALLLLACWLAVLVNPYGWQLPRDWIMLMQSEVVARYMVEHQPLNPRNPYQQPILLLGLVYLGGLVLAALHVGIRNVRVTWLLPLVWFVLTVQRVRHCTLFAVTATVAIGDVLAQTRMAAVLAADEWLYRPNQPPAPLRRVLVLPVAVALLGTALLATGVWRNWAQVESELAPVALLEPLAQHTRPGDAIFNDMAYGGFLIYYLPDRRIFMDDRCELYGDAFLSDFFETNRAYLKAPAAELPTMRRFEEWATQYGFRTALVRKTSGFDRYLASVPDQWEKISEITEQTPTGELRWGAVLYQRRSPNFPIPPSE